MEMQSYFGYRCPRCGSTVDIGVATGDPACPSCGTKMEPNSSGRGAAANVYCAKCDAAFGLVNSDRCPQCGGPFTALPT
jgi:rRNA maturation endonuclease Nob1